MIKKMAGNAMREEEIIAAVYKNLCRPGDLLLDIGCNYGYHAQRMLEVAVDGLVVGVEAHPNHVERLNKLFDENSNFQLIAKAVVPETMSDVSHVTFKISKDFHGRGGFEKLNIWEKVDPSITFQEISVEAISFDRLLSELPTNPSFIKMDIEGPEYSILAVTKLLGIDISCPCITFENSVHGPGLGGLDFSDIYEQWILRGYKFIDTEGNLVENEAERKRAGQTLFLVQKSILTRVQVLLYSLAQGRAAGQG
jgi:FkbM family methyltransferase